MSWPRRSQTLWEEKLVDRIGSGQHLVDLGIASVDDTSHHRLVPEGETVQGEFYYPFGLYHHMGILTSVFDSQQM